MFEKCVHFIDFDFEKWGQHWDLEVQNAAGQDAAIWDFVVFCEFLDLQSQGSHLDQLVQEQIVDLVLAKVGTRIIIISKLPRPQ